MPTERLDVLVVGAGLAGLSTARALADAGRRVVVLEARPDVGGRLASVALDPADESMSADVGAEWVGKHHVRVRRLAAQAGLSLVPTRFIAAGARWRADGLDTRGRRPPLPARDWWRLTRTFVALDALSRRIDPVAPWTSAAAAGLDTVTFGDWLHQRDLDGVAYDLLDTLVGDLVSQPIDRLSLLHVVWWVSRNHGAVAGLRSAFDHRLQGGTQALARHLGAGLDVRTGQRVVGLGQGRTGVEATTKDGSTVAAHVAVLAIPAPRLLDLQHEPELPAGQVRLATELDIDPATKIVARLRRVPRSAPRVVLGGKPLTACWRYGARVTGFARPPYDLVDESDLVAALAESFDVRSGDLVGSHVQRWAREDTIAGCDVCFHPGQLTDLGPHLRRSHDRVVFAGSERSSWPNNMEGALESGAAAARWAMAG